MFYRVLDGIQGSRFQLQAQTKLGCRTKKILFQVQIQYKHTLDWSGVLAFKYSFPLDS